MLNKHQMLSEKLYKKPLSEEKWNSRVWVEIKIAFVSGGIKQRLPEENWKTDLV